MSILAEKAPETVSRTSICTRSGKNSNEYINLLFCTDKIVFCNKLSKRYRVKTRTMTNLELRENLGVVNFHMFRPSFFALLQFGFL